MVTDGSKTKPKTKLSSAPPSELNVRRFAESRASELESLHNIVANRLNNDFRCQRNKRKRTTGHDNRGSKKRRFRKGDNSNTSKKDEKKVSRRVRRSIQLKNNLPSGFGTSGDGTKRLRTHVWHAKRFTMNKLWGFHIPIGLHGRGRGSRALLKKLNGGVLVHDASYCSALQLEGSQENLISILSSVLVHPQSHSEAISHDILAGNIFGSAVLHSAGNPCLPSIAPVTYMWRPLGMKNTDTESGGVDVSKDQLNFEKEPTFRQLWVWIHAAAFEEAYETLRLACAMQMDTSGGVAQCISLEGQLGKLELVGSKAFELLQKTLFPVWSISENSWHLKKCSADDHDDHAEPEKRCIFNNFDQISSSAVIPVTVMDPRILTKKEDVSVPEGNSLNLIGSENTETIEHSIPSLPKLEPKGVADESVLWDASKGLCSPLEENVVNMEKYNHRKDFFRLGPKNTGTRHASFDEKYSRSCPIFVLKNGDHEDSVMRCSIVLPLSWVKVFWLNFISQGAQAIGLREMRWAACEIGMPYFPFDFPDSSAYNNTMKLEAVVSNQEAALRPPSKRPLEVPIPPPWNCVPLNFDKGSNINWLSERSETKLFECPDVQFESFVARTSRILSDFVNTNHLILFPRTPGEKNCLYKIMKDEELLKQDIITPDVKNDKAQCFVRVLLRAYKEGVFEQGAVVCAPHISDIKLWTRSESLDKQLQIPESLLQSYFVKVPSGKWELQVPEDPAVLESFRWPIGFVTTGFVRGSKKATAGAFCEAALLSKIRMEQWKEFPVRQRRKEIYVLVRNMRSTAYRLALATISLEQVEEDVKFM